LSFDEHAAAPIATTTSASSFLTSPLTVRRLAAPGANVVGS
jgi:hypothetical protein